MSSSRTMEMQKHYEIWGSKATAITFDKGPVHDLPQDFCVFEVPPAGKRDVWIYGSSGMSFGHAKPIEVFLMSPRKAPEVAELFYAIAHYHLTGEQLDAGHTVNLGRPWLPGSQCDHAVLTMFEEPTIDWATIDQKKVHFLWMIPITKAEREYKKMYGIEALDKKFDKLDVKCEDPLRKSAI